MHSVELIETHISWVLLAGEWAYKIKHPISYPFVDLRSAEHRAFLCQEEMRLNRRFAPDLYVGVCPITQSHGQVCMAGTGAVIEHAVKMRQFPREEVLEPLQDAKFIDAHRGRPDCRVHAVLRFGKPRVPSFAAGPTPPYVWRQ